MTQEPFDPTAGETARRMREHPGEARRILDATDPRYGEFPAETRERTGGEPRIVDPTDPRNREPAA